MVSFTGFTDHERHRGNRGWESTSIPLQWADPLPLLAVSGTPQVGKNYLLDEKCPVRGFVSIAPTSLAWKDRVGSHEVKLTQGLAVSLHAKYSCTIPNGSWTHRRALFRGDPEKLVRVFYNERLRQETLEKTGHCSIAHRSGRCCALYRRYMEPERSGVAPSLTLLRSLRQLGERSLRSQGTGIQWMRGPCQIQKKETRLSSGATTRDRWLWSGTAWFRVNRRVQRRLSRKKTTGSSDGSNPREVSLEIE